MKRLEDDRVQAFAAFVLGYLCLCFLPQLDPIAKQREVLARVRTVLRKDFGLARIQVRRAEDEDGVLDGQHAPGWRLPPLALTLVLLLQLVANLLEGRTTYAFHVTYITACLGMCIAFGSYQTVVNFGRVGYLHHVISLLAVIGAGTLDRNLIIRAIITRTVSCVTLTERLDESFVQMGGVSLILGMYRGWSDPLAFLPMRMFFSFILPTNILGLRDWLSSSRILSKKHAPTFGTLKLSPKLFVAITLPMTLLLVPLFESSPRRNSSYMVIFVNAISSLGFAILSGTIDNLLMSATISEMMKEKSVSHKVEAQVSGDDDAPIRVSANRLATACSLAAWMLLAHELFPFTLEALLIGVCSLAASAIWKPSLVDRLWTSLTLLASSDLFLVVSHGVILIMLGISTRGKVLNPWHTSCIVVVLTSRLLCSFDRTTISKLEIRSSIIFALAAGIVHWSDSELMRFVSIATVIGHVMNFLVVLSKEGALQLSKRENDAYAFFSHALKQKYCAVGSAAELAIDAVETAELGSPTKLRTALLKDIIVETRRGHDACHAVSLMRNVRYQMYHGNAVTRRALKEEMDFLIERGIVQGNRVVLTGDLNDTIIEMDIKWDVLKAFVVHFTTRMSKVHFHYERGGECLSVTVLPKTCFLESDEAVILAVAKTLGAVSIANGTFALAVTSSTVHPSPTGSDVSTASSVSIEAGKKALPANMVFAVVDDTALIRLSVKRALESRAGAHPRSIYVGQTAEECFGFPQQVLELSPDIVLLDENLVDDIRGTDLARTIRRLGFKKCLLLHSAGNLSSDMPLDPSFDGMVEKTSSRDELVQNISKMYHRHLGSMLRSAVHADGSLSPHGSGLDDASSATTMDSTSPVLLKQKKHYAA